MESFEYEIKQNNLERIKSIGYQVLEKGIINDLSYDLKSGKDKPLKVTKAGKEIKEKLIQETQSISNLKQSYYNKMMLISKEIEINPIKELDSYSTEDWGGKIPIPLTYCYSQMIDDYNKTDIEDASKMREYNRIARQWFDKSVEEKKINTVVNAIDDKKLYELNIGIASKLGF